MNKFIFCFIYIVSFCSVANSQSNHHIKIDVKNYENDTLVLGSYYGDRQLVQDTIIRNEEGDFDYYSEELLSSGVYMILYLPDHAYTQIVINENENDFEITLDFNHMDQAKFTNSLDNKIFYEYLAFLSIQRVEADKLNAIIEKNETDSKSVENEKAALDKLDKNVISYQNKLIAAYPETVTGLLLKTNSKATIPDFEGAEDEIKEKEYRYYKEHFFDNVDLGNPISLHLPVTDRKIDTYLKNLTMQHPDSIVVSMDYLLAKMAPSEKAFRYYLSQFINDAVKSNRVGMDAVYVHLVDNYYAKGLTPWTSEDNMTKLLKNANDLRPILIGKTAPDLILYKEDGTPVVLSEIDADYKVIMFWAPKCGHCTKAMPAAIAFYKKYKEKGVEFISICTKTGKKFKSCWEAIEEKDMGLFLNLGDEYARSRFKSKYYVRQTPKIFVLDRDQKILVKDIGAEQLDQLMDEILKSNNEQSKNVIDVQER